MKEITIVLNAKLQPMHRTEMFEEPLGNALSQAEAGELLGGGTLQSASGEIESCDITLAVNDDRLEQIIDYIRKIRIIPKGSRIICGEETVPIGQAEGLALYLNGTDLPADVYRTNDINELISALQDALAEKCFMFSWWEGSNETALYFYGENYLEMHESIKSVVNTYPLCRLSRIKQIA